MIRLSNFHLIKPKKQTPILLNTTHCKTPKHKKKSKMANMLSWIFRIVLREVSLNELLSEGSNSERFCCIRWTKIQEKDIDASHMAFCIFLFLKKVWMRRRDQ
ncbi:hypothetical protein HanRHA438_Chr11g0493331 [Helianthus annuus]|nr:hypothetical protein HanRHA438_Chr11g0493331 [Helianthus annuus]